MKNQKTKKTQKGGSNLNTNKDGPLRISFENESHHDVAHLFFAADSCHDSKKVNKGGSMAFQKKMISFQIALDRLDPDKSRLFSERF